ncbi:MAG: hypothetical protein M3401_16905 [Actinomycetota bacterium]|nr:hypothetical protein [Actinomycetota bacterium]
MSTVWIVSLAFAWAVIALLTACTVTLLRQVGELRARVEGGSAAAPAACAGPRLYDVVERVELPLPGAGGATVAVGGEQERPALLAVHAPGCSSCADIEEALEAVARERADVAVVSVVALERRAAAEHVAAVDVARRAVSVAVQDVPPELVPDGLPALVAIAREGFVAALGAPETIDHLREAANVAAGAVLIAGPGSMRDTDWGRAVPAWGVEGAPALDILRVDGRGA